MNNTTSTNTTQVHTDPGRNPVDSGHAGSGVGNKVKGAFEVVHGAGENLRGTVLGAVDTMGRHGPTKNDEIARQGRLEMERGLANLKGSKAAPQMGNGADTVTGTANTSATAAPGTYGTQTQTHYPPATGGRKANEYTTGGNSYDIGEPGTTTATSGLGHNNTTTHYPSHHRDDAVAGIPTPEIRDAQAVYHNQQGGAALGTTDASTLPQSMSTKPEAGAYNDQRRQQTTGVGGRDDQYQFGKESGYSAGENLRSMGTEPGMRN